MVQEGLQAEIEHATGVAELAQQRLKEALHQLDAAREVAIAPSVIPIVLNVAPEYLFYFQMTCRSHWH